MKRKLIQIEVDGIDHSDFPDFVDAYINSAVWADTLESLTEEELDEVNKDTGLVYEAVQEHLY